jgi:hypothetical protein
LNDGENTQPTEMAPRRAEEYPARGTERDRGNYRCEGRRVPQSWRPSTMPGYAIPGNWPNLLRRAIGGVELRLELRLL